MHTARKAAPLLGLAALAALGFAFPHAAWAQQTIIPGGSTGTEGNSLNAVPFNYNPSITLRCQQVYDADSFSALSGAEYITALSFRPDGVYGSAFSSTLPDVQIDLSTTSAAADHLSQTFAANVGADDQVVFTGPLSLSSKDTGSARGPKDFDITINLQTPFLYDPSQGNLLLDMRNFGGGDSTTYFDASSVSNDPISELYSYSASATSGTPNTLGLITRFTFAPAVTSAPEPSSTAVFAVGGLGALGLMLRARKRKSVA